MTEPVVEQHAVLTFEGDVVSELEGRLPALNMSMVEGYTRNTHLRLDVEVRVRNVSMTENRKGELVRIHQFELVGISVASAFDPTAPDPGAADAAAGGTVDAAVQPPQPTTAELADGAAAPAPFEGGPEDQSFVGF